MLVAVGALFLAACGGPDLSEEPVAVPTTGSPGSASPSAGPSIPPGTQMIGTCAILPNTSCPGANLTTAPLAGANLRGADLHGANLFGADLRGTDLRGAILKEADIRNADLTGAVLTRSSLESSNFAHANLFQTDFKNSDVTAGQIKNALRCETILANGAQDDSNCNDADLPSPAPESSPASDGGGAKVRIDSFSGPSTVTCTSNSSEVTVRVRFSTQHAKTIEFEVDGKPISGDQTFDGDDTRADLTYACKANRHRYTLVASGKSSTASETITVQRSS